MQLVSGITISVAILINSDKIKEKHVLLNLIPILKAVRMGMFAMLKIAALSGYLNTFDHCTNLMWEQILVFKTWYKRFWTWPGINCKGKQFLDKSCPLRSTIKIKEFSEKTVPSRTKSRNSRRGELFIYHAWKELLAIGRWLWPLNDCLYCLTIWQRWTWVSI